MSGRRASRASEHSLSPKKEHNASYHKAKKDHSMKQLGKITRAVVKLGRECLCAELVSVWSFVLSDF